MIDRMHATSSQGERPRRTLPSSQSDRLPTRTSPLPVVDSRLERSAVRTAASTTRPFRERPGAESAAAAADGRRAAAPTSFVREGAEQAEGGPAGAASCRRASTSSSSAAGSPLPKVGCVTMPTSSSPAASEKGGDAGCDPDETRAHQPWQWPQSGHCPPRESDAQSPSPKSVVASAQGVLGSSSSAGPSTFASSAIADWVDADVHRTNTSLHVPLPLSPSEKQVVRKLYALPATPVQGARRASFTTSAAAPAAEEEGATTGRQASAAEARPPCHSSMHSSALPPGQSQRQTRTTSTTRKHEGASRRLPHALAAIDAYAPQSFAEAAWRSAQLTQQPRARRRVQQQQYYTSVQSLRALDSASAKARLESVPSLHKVTTAPGQLQRARAATAASATTLASATTPALAEAAGRALPLPRPVRTPTTTMWWGQPKGAPMDKRRPSRSGYEPSTSIRSAAEWPSSQRPSGTLEAPNSSSLELLKLQKLEYQIWWASEGKLWWGHESKLPTVGR